MMATLWSLLLLSTFTQTPIFQVQDLSADFVYLDAGRAQGLETGIRLWVLSPEGDTLAEIEVVAVAENSAACRILAQKGPISPGDPVIPQTPFRPPQERPQGEARPSPPSPPAEEGPAEIPPQAPRRPVAPFARISGGISYGFFGIQNEDPFRPDFSQNTGRLTLRMRDIRGSGYGLYLQIRTRSNRRTVLILRPSLPTAEGQNRFYEMAFGYEKPNAHWQYRIGRIASNPFIGMGYLDGGIVQFRGHSDFRVGAFFGFKPDLTQLRPRLSHPKGGLFLGWASSLSGRGRYTLTASATGEYREGQIHREYLYLQSILSLPGRVTVYQSAELDINRGWRRAREKDLTRLSLFYLTVTMPFLKRGSIGLSLSHYRRYWTSEVRDLPDSLFDRRARRSASLRVGWSRLPGGFHTSGTYTLRSLEGVPGRDYTAMLQISHGHFTPLHLLLSAQQSWYRNQVSRGDILVLHLGKSFKGHRLGLTYGRSRTELLNLTLPRRENRWLRVDLSLNLPWGFYLLGQYERDRGSDLQGTRLLLETGYRF